MCESLRGKRNSPHPDLSGQPVDIHPSQREELALTETRHRRREVHRALDTPHVRVCGRVRLAAAQVDRGRLGDADRGCDLLPRQLLHVPQGSDACGTLQRLRVVAIANAGCFEQRLELRGVEKADVAIDAVRLRLLGEPARVLVRPTLADREVDDPVQEPKVVVRALDRMLGKALLDEILDVVGP